MLQDFSYLNKNNFLKCPCKKVNVFYGFAANYFKMLKQYNARVVRAETKANNNRKLMKMESIAEHNFNSF
jgi:hypothetical protein